MKLPEKSLVNYYFEFDFMLIMKILMYICTVLKD